MICETKYATKARRHKEEHKLFDSMIEYNLNMFQNGILLFVFNLRNLRNLWISPYVDLMLMI